MQRRHDLDWVRVLAFALLVPYHVGMYYVSWDWHVKSPELVTALEPLMMLVTGGIVGTLVVAMYLPVFNLGDALGCGYHHGFINR